MKISPIFAIDGYKLGHRAQYPDNTSLIYGNFTPRNNKYFKSPFFDSIRESGSPLIWAGAQAFVLQWLKDEFEEGFFQQDKATIVAKFKASIDSYLGKDAVPEDGIADLHDLGYLPLVIKSIPEGSWVEMKVPTLTIRNTDERFFWLVNYLETLMSAELWPVATAATIAFNYQCIGEYWARKTCDDNTHLPWQFHDFSARGDMGMWANTLVGMGHMMNFTGTDSVFARERIMEQYKVGENYLYGASVNATEHSVMCMGTKDNEIGTFERLIQEVYPTGILSIVSDTWDYWKVITEYLPALADVINEREGKVVIRPDSGDPVDIICGLDWHDFSERVAHLGELQTILSTRGSLVGKFHNEYFQYDSTKECLVQVPEHVVVGSIEMLWRVFGGTINKQGYKVLNPKIGLIYGDSINLERAEIILKKLAAKSFASSNVVLGIGSFTYQYVTRDTFGFAMKATWGVVDGEAREVFKDPATDDGLKKSHKGLIKHTQGEYGVWEFKDSATPEEEAESELDTIYVNGKVLNKVSLETVRGRIKQAVNMFVGVKTQLEA